jgi:hypothetical protein
VKMKECEIERVGKTNKTTRQKEQHFENDGKDTVEGAPKEEELGPIKDYINSTRNFQRFLLLSRHASKLYTWVLY